VVKCKIIFSVVFIGTLFMIIFLATYIPSIKYVNYDQYALRQSKFSQVDLTVVYGPGRYFLSPLDEMIYFPSTIQLIDIESTVFDNLGQEEELHIAFYYQLPSDRIGDIYHQFSMDYEDRIVNIVKTTVKNIAPMYTVDDYVSNRTVVEENFSQNVHQQLISTIGIDIPVLYFRLLEVTLQDSVIQSALASAVELQNNQIQMYSQNVAVIQAETNNEVAVIDVETNYVLADANIQASQIISNSQSTADSIVLSARAEALEDCLATLNVTSPDLRNKFVRLAALLDGQDPKIYSGSFGSLLIQE